jgi:hypothetical protein
MMTMTTGGEWPRGRGAVAVAAAGKIVKEEEEEDGGYGHRRTTLKRPQRYTRCKSLRSSRHRCHRPVRGNAIAFAAIVIIVVGRRPFSSLPRLPRVVRC